MSASLACGKIWSTTWSLLAVAAPLAVLSCDASAPAGGAETGPAASSSAPILVEGERALMGVRFAIQVVAPGEASGTEAIAAALDEVARVESHISEWRDDSEISAVNRAAGRQPTPVGPDLYEVVARGVEMGRLTGGAFDLTFASCGRYWSIRERRRPTPEQLADCLPHIGYQRIELDPVARTIFLPDPDSVMGVGGIGQGYGVDRAAAVLEARGLHDYLIDGSGDMRVSGTHMGRPWTLGIADPRQEGRRLATVRLAGGALVTSGDYHDYFEEDGVRYHHILDPATGMPARRAVAATVIGPDATTADALATGLVVMGPEAGLALVERMPDVEALIVAPDLSVSWSSGLAPFLGTGDGTGSGP